MKLESSIQLHNFWTRVCVQNLYLLIPLGLVLIYSIFLIDLPISEDTAFYGFLAKQINNGALLHVDIPVSTHGIFIYELAVVFKIFDSSVYALRIFYLIHLSILIYFLTLILNDISNKYIATLISSYTLILISLPSIALDIGRSPHVIAACFLIIAIYVLFISSISKKYVIGGILLGLAAITRETYSLYFIPFFILAFRKGEYKNFLLGYIPICVLFIGFIFITSDVDMYLRDMLVSGVKFRVGPNGGFFSSSKFITNYDLIEVIIRNYASTFVLLGLMGYFIRSSNELINYIKYYIVPCALFIEIIINKATSYSIQPILILLSPIVIESLVWIFSIFSLKFKLLFSNTFNIKIFVATLLIVFSCNNFMNTYDKYSSYNKVVKNFTSKKYLDSNPYRLLSVIEEIPHNSISTYSEYPLVFLSKVNYLARFPYLEDLSASNNMNRSDIWIASLDRLKSSPPDILVDKTTDVFLGKETPFGVIRANNYLEIAKFAPALDAKVVDAYAERIAVSNKIISNMHIIKTLKITGSTFQYFNDLNNAVIIKIYPVKNMCELSILNNLSKVISSDDNERTYITSIVLPKTSAIIKRDEIICNNQMSLEVYSFDKK